MPGRLRVLIVEDSADDVVLLVRELERDGREIMHHRVQSAAQLASALEDGPWDIVISDCSLPQFSGLDALAVARKRSADLPFILVSGTDGEETAVEAMKAGANNYLFKGNLTRLGPTVDREIREAASRRAARRTQDELAAAPASGTASLVPHPPHSGQSTSINCRILLVEDHEDTLHIVARILRSHGYDVRTATDVQSAVGLLGSESFDVLISDIGLPDGTGLDIMRHARSAQLPLKGIAMSGFGMDDDLRRSREAGFEQHLTKPVGVDQLVAAVRQAAMARA